MDIGERILWTVLIALGGLGFTCLVVSIPRWLGPAIQGVLDGRGRPKVVVMPVAGTSPPPKAGAAVQPQAAREEAPRDDLAAVWAEIDQTIRATRRRVLCTGAPQTKLRL